MFRQPSDEKQRITYGKETVYNENEVASGRPSKASKKDQNS